MAYLDLNCKTNTLFVGGWEPPLPMATAAAGLVHHSMAPVWDDQGANIHQQNPEQEWILHWQWSCSEGNAVFHSRGQNFVCLSVLTTVLVVAAPCPAPDAGCGAAHSQSHGQAPSCFESLTQVLPPKPSFNSVFISERGSHHSALRLFWKVASALGSDGGTQSHWRKELPLLGRRKWDMWASC